MASLKEVKGRIASVNGTLKITSAMKMVASAKLHKAQERIEGMLPYEEKLSYILNSFLESNPEVDTLLTTTRPVKKAALVVFASNGSLCGGYNSNVIHHFREWVEAHESLGRDNLIIYPIGRKIEEAVCKAGFTPAGQFIHMADKPNREDAYQLADELTKRFEQEDFDSVDLLYNHFKSTATQILTLKPFLPIDISRQNENDSHKTDYNADYIIEPSAEIFMKQLLPQVLRTQLFTALLDANASEHAARTMAMQVATDNANDLLQDLTLQYNKSRQQVITNELLDIVSGSMA